MVNRRMRGIAPLLLVAVTLAGCDGAGQPGEDVLARAGDHLLDVDAAAGLLAGENELPAQPDVVNALAELWIDYTLLARAAAGDSTLGSVDLTTLARQQVDRERVLRLREAVIQVDTVVSDEELEEAYRQEAPGTTVEARHILLTVPQGATPAQADSVRALATSLRQQIVEGGDFAALAQEYSQDPGSAVRGGELGSFQRGQMVEAFDDAAFALEPGEVSEVVESPFGLHIIRVDGKEVPPFDEIRDQFRLQFIGARVAEAEAEYLTALEGPANVQIVDEAYSAMREMAERPQLRLGSRAGDRALVTFEGGTYRARDFQEWVQGQPPALRAQIQSVEDEQLEGLLRSLAQERLLVARAIEEGIDVSQEEQDTILSEARIRFAEATRSMGLGSIDPQEGESTQDAIDRVVMATLASMLRGERDVIPLGAISYGLREGNRAEVFQPAVQRTVARVNELRGGAGPALPPGMQLPGMEPQAPPAQPAPPGSN